jgi:hypothetical protein
MHLYEQILELRHGLGRSIINPAIVSPQIGRMTGVTIRYDMCKIFKALNNMQMRKNKICKQTEMIIFIAPDVYTIKIISSKL